MVSRLELQTVLENVMGSEEVYFQPPASIRMTYPAIRYAIKNVDSIHANDSSYGLFTAYELTLIDFNPDTEFLRKILSLPRCKFDRFYTADNLNHWTFTIYY